MQNYHRILFNTVIMYSKTIFNILIGLVTTRYVLEFLGINDFGIFGLVGSIVGLLEFLNHTMTEATQRFLSYYRKQSNFNTVFSTSIILHFLIGIIVIVLLELAGFLFFDMLNIATERRETAYFVFHCVVMITFFSIIATPYQALMNANEDMSYMAIFSMAETLIKLGIALFIFVSPYDRLGTYAVAMMVLAILMRITLRIFCKIRYPNVSFSYKVINRNLTNKMLSFSSWNFFDSICIVFRIKGLSIILNLFFGTAMNAVFNLASQVTAQVSTFSNSLAQAAAPQIISGTASQNLDRPKRLSLSSCKLQLFLVSLFSVPLILNIDYVLSVWLKQVPKYLSTFCCLALINEILLNFTRGLQNLIIGIGHIRGFKITMGLSNFIVLLIAYILLKMNYPPYSIYIAILTMPITINLSRIYFAHRHVQLNVPHFLKEMSKVMAMVIFSFLCAWMISNYQPLAVQSVSQFAKLLITTTLSSSLMLTGFWLALSSKEKEFAKDVWEKIRKKVLSSQTQP